MVQRLANDGFAVAVHYAGSRDKADEVARTARDAGAHAIVVGADAADEDAVAAMFDEVEQELGGVDVLVHSAGIMLLAPLADLALDDFDRMHRTNVRGTFVVAREAVKRLRAGGAIINFRAPW